MGERGNGNLGEGRRVKMEAGGWWEMDEGRVLVVLSMEEVYFKLFELHKWLLIGHLIA